MQFNVGITGTGSLIGQAIIKSIIRSDYSDNYNLVGFDYFTDTVGSFLCKKNHILPDIYNNKNLIIDWLKLFIKLILEEKLDIIFVGVDFELMLFSKFKSEIELETKCKIIISPEKVIEIGNDKYLTYKFLKKNNLNYPKTFLPNEIKFENIKFPIIVKPRVGARSVGVYKVHNLEDLKSKIKTIVNPIIQEYIGDESDEYTCGIIYFDQELKSSIAIKRTLKNGNTFISEFNNSSSKEIDKYILRIANVLKPYGSCNFQLRIDKNGIPKLFEINPRHSGTTFIRSLFGYNEIIFILKYVLENKSLKFKLKDGKAIRFFEEKLI